MEAEGMSAWSIERTPAGPFNVLALAIVGNETRPAAGPPRPLHLDLESGPLTLDQTEALLRAPDALLALRMVPFTSLFEAGS